MINRTCFSPAGDPTGPAERRVGPAAETPLVLLHEGLGSVSAWGSFPARLAEATGRWVLAYDRAGYGRSGSPAPSPWPARFMHTEARRLDDLLADEGLERVVLVGHSDGGSIALLHPSQAVPGRVAVAAVVSMSAHVMV
ncbi:MAG: alpha/beta fold hydrolase, partial [Acidimicrobiales bacterium]